jgi:hypothetical protein
MTRFAVLLAGLALVTAPAHCHDIYASVTNRSGFNCCNGQDCRPAPYRATASGVEMLIDGRWLPMNDNDIQYRAIPGDTGETNGGHWCGRYIELAGGFVTYCAFLPPHSAALPHSTGAVFDISGGRGTY